MGKPLVVRFTKISPTLHQFEFVRADGTGESTTLGTRSFWLHDLLHFAVESEAGLKNAFYGLLAQGHSYAQLAARNMSQGTTVDWSEVWLVETIVGPLTSVIQEKFSSDAFLLTMKEKLELDREPWPAWLNAGFVERVQERMRQLLGQWKATPYNETMELRFQV